MKLSVVIPAYNESENVGPTIRNLMDAVKRVQDLEDYEILVVDDHSEDDTFEHVVALRIPNVRCMRLSRRSGSHLAIRAGLRQCSGGCVLVIAMDGQDDPATLAQMMEKLRQGAHVVWALRKKRQEPFLARIFARLFYFFLNILVPSARNQIDVSRADFFALDPRALAALNVHTERLSPIFGLITNLGFHQECVEYERKGRRYGSSKWDFRSRVHVAKDWIVAFSGIPLRVATRVGIIVASAGALYAILLVFNAILGHPVTGWSSLMVVVLILSGTQLVLIGVVGEYLWQNLQETKCRPLFHVEKWSDGDEAT